MKSILMSIRPRHVANILNKLKTKEIRKRFPKDYRGWVYIYCTKEKDLLSDNGFGKYYIVKTKECKDIVKSQNYQSNGKVIARFYCDNVDSFYYFDDDLLELACIDREQALDYLGKKEGYAINISQLEIFDIPKELSEFYKGGDWGCDKAYYGEEAIIKKAPQNFMYIEVEEWDTI